MKKIFFMRATSLMCLAVLSTASALATDVDLYNAIKNRTVQATRDALPTANPNALYNGQTLLHLIIQGQPTSEPSDKTRQLIRIIAADSRTNINQPNKDGKTAYQYAMGAAQIAGSRGNQMLKKIYTEIADTLKILGGK